MQNFSAVPFSYLLSFWILCAVSIGGMTGMLVELETNVERVSRRGAIWASIVFISGVVLDVFGGLPGLVRAYLDTALLFFGLFFLSALTATIAVQRPLQFYRGWAYGVLPVALVWPIATYYGLPLWQAQAKAEIVELARKVNIDASDVSFAGREALLTPRIATDSWLVGEIGRVSGIRGVVLLSAIPEALRDAPAPGVPQLSDVDKRKATVEPSVPSPLRDVPDGSGRVERALEPQPVGRSTPPASHRHGSHSHQTLHESHPGR